MKRRAERLAFRVTPAEFHPEWGLTYLGGVGNAENTRREVVQP